MAKRTLAEMDQNLIDGEDNLEEQSPSRVRQPIPTARSGWTAPTWFLLGLLVGVVSFAAFTMLTARPGLDAAALKEAVRDGSLEANATLQAANPQQAISTPRVLSEAQNPTSGTPDIPSVAQTSFVLRDANRVGDKNAPVTIVEFSDFQCPFCGRHFQNVEPVLFEEYVDTGKVTFVYKHSAFLGLESVWAAQASECAADQGKFWDYHDLLFTRQAGENQGAFTKDKLLSFAEELNLDMTQFEPCLINDQTLDRVQADTQEGQQAGVRGTPTFFINGQPLVGAQPYEEFRAAIEKNLGAATE